MKKIIALLGLVIFLTNVKAQTGFPSTDSLHRYNNRYIRHSAVEAFSNLRLNTLLHGIISWIDTARAEGTGEGSTVIGVDTIYKLNDSTIRYRRNGVTYNVTLSSLYGVRNGLTKYGGVIGFGGTLEDDTTFLDFNSNKLIFETGVFIHADGDYVDQISPYNIFNSNGTYLQSSLYDGDVTTEFLNTLGSGGQVKLQALKASTSKASWVIASPESLDLNQSDGNTHIRNLIDSVQTHAVYIDPSDGRLTYGLAASGSGGGVDSVFGVDDNIASGNRDFNLNSNGITLHDGLFTHGTGNYLTSSGTFSRTDLAEGYHWFRSDDGNGNYYSALFSLPGQQIVLTSADTIATSQLDLHNSDGIFISHSYGKVFVPNLRDSAQAKSVYYDPISGLLTYGDATAGSGVLGGTLKTQIQTTSNVGDSLLVKVNDSLYTQKKLRAGANITIAHTDSTITITATPGSAEINTIPITLSGSGSFSISDDALLETILVKPTSNLSGFQVGIIGDETKYSLTSIPITATSEYVALDFGVFLPGSTNVRLTGITNSTDIKVIYKVMHE